MNEDRVMKIPEAQYKRVQKYLKEQTKQIAVQLYKNTDADMIVWIESQDNKQGYIKRLIREDMERSGFKPE